MNKMVITKNTRISVYHSFGVWALTIRNVKASDRGWYMCQTNTDPMESQMGFLDVTGTYVKNNFLCEIAYIPSILEYIWIVTGCYLGTH